MIQEVLQSCHDSLEGGHQGVVRTYQRVKQDYYWFGLYTDVEKHMKSCPDCSSSKSRPHLRGYSPGNVLAERPFQIVSMDFVIPLPKSQRESTIAYQTRQGPTLHERGLPGLRLNDAVKVQGYPELSAKSQWATREVRENSDAIGQSLCRRPAPARLG
ncbi:unnamed protein product [Phytophthora lilii]|uniref:Unnamed protein product n=1 Tax=Phytophthora lilii TaxID=2077276 RepID=A0A9W6XKK0_9STRA|nr:unnamed protein product [Phytophthora lilii]